MENNILDINNKISNLERKLEIIEQKIDKLLNISNKMDDHIDFVEHSYSIIRGPLNYIKDKINLLNGIRGFISEDLPTINYDNTNNN
jgi:hypothetical protein